MNKAYYEWLKNNNTLLENMENKEKRHDLESICVGRDIIDGNIKASLEQMRK